MKICKTILDNKVQSYYLICRNSENKYQAVAYPWGRIDYREFDSEEEVFNEILKQVSKRGWNVEWTNLSLYEK